jgi:hypothetical protein
MNIPSWFPFSATSFEKSGSKTVEKKLRKDIDVFMANVMRVYGDWSRDEARAMKEHPFRKRFEALGRYASRISHRMKYTFETHLQPQQFRDEVQNKLWGSVDCIKSWINTQTQKPALAIAPTRVPMKGKFAITQSS